MSTRKRVAAFTLVEILIVVSIIGVVASMMPRLIRRAPTTEWSHVLNELNNLIYFARQEAIGKQHVYRLAFHAPTKGEHTMLVEHEQENPKKPGTKQFVPVSSDYISTLYSLPEVIKIDAVYLGKKEQLSEQKQRAFCHVVHNGLVQDCMIHMSRVLKEKETKVSFTVQPFLGVFELHEGTMKPR